MQATRPPTRSQRRQLLQAGVIVLGLLPLALLGFDALRGDLGANPIETLTHATGDAGLRLLLASLAVTPLRRLFGWSWAAPLRRTLGLLAFLYVTLHMLTYVALDHFFEWELLQRHVEKRQQPERPT